MQLFTPPKAKEYSKARKDADLVQVGHLRKTLKTLQNSINTESANFEKMLKEQQELYIAEKMRLQSIVRDLEADIKSKQTAREALLIPIETIKKDVEELHKKVLVKMKEVEEREEELDEMTILLQDKLDSASEAEQTAHEILEANKSKQQGIADEAQMISNSHIVLNKKIQEFDITSKRKLKALMGQEEALVLKQTGYQTYVDNTEKKFIIREKAVADREAMLKRGFEELETLKNKKK